MSSSGAQVEHIFTVDVEEYFQVAAFEGVLSRKDWGTYPSRLDGAIDGLLDVLARHGATGTFFTLGWVADHRPHIVRRIVQAGHEIASHGYWHRRVHEMRPQEFRDDVRASKRVLEDVAGAPVVGFRAPNFSIRPGCEWAFDVLLEEGFQYDSSLFPIRRPGYGYPASPVVPHVVHRAGGALFELPLATTSWNGARLPAAGGAYLRHLPFGLVRRAFAEHTVSCVPATFYVHPWEIDPEQPRLPVGPVTRLRHYGGLARTLPRIERLLAEFRFASAARCVMLAPLLRPQRARSMKVSNVAE